MSVFELALTPECQSDLVPGDRFAYASPNRSFPMRLTWDMSVHAQLTKPAHTALQLLLRRGAVAGYLELGLYSLYAPLGLCYL